MHKMKTRVVKVAGSRDLDSRTASARSCYRGGKREIRDIRIILASNGAGLEMTSASAGGDSCLSHNFSSTSSFRLLLFSARSSIRASRAFFSFVYFFLSFVEYSFAYISAFNLLNPYIRKRVFSIVTRYTSLLGHDNGKCMIRPSRWTL